MVLRAKKEREHLATRADIIMRMECESVANSYTKYIHSVDSLNARYGNRIRKELSPTRKVNNHLIHVTWSYLILSYWLWPNLICVESLTE